MSKYYLILNPTAKSNKGKRHWDTIFKLLDESGVRFDVGESSYAGHSVALAKEATESGKYDVIVSVGGDGTINEVLNGIRQGGERLETLPVLGILYTGTSPDICKFHGIALEMDKAVETLIRGEASLVDVGEVDYIKDEKEHTSWFLCSVNLGIGARVADGSNSGLRKYLGDLLGTLVSILKSVILYKRADLQLTVDGKQQTFPSTLNMTIGKNPYIASGVKVDVPTKADDGKMYLFSINNMGLGGILLNLLKVYNGTLHKHRKASLEYAQEVTCEYSALAPEVEFDGDPQGHLPCTVRVLHKKIGLIK